MMIDNPPLIAIGLSLVHLSPRLHVLSFEWNGIKVSIKIDEDNQEYVVCKATDPTSGDIYFQAPVVDDELLLMRGVIQYAVQSFTTLAAIEKDFSHGRVN